MAAVPEEFQPALQEAGVSLADATKYYETFKTYDKDGSGTIDSDELFSCLQVMGLGQSKDEVDKLMKEHDDDNNGCLDFVEFAKLMTHVSK